MNLFLALVGTNIVADYFHFLLVLFFNYSGVVFSSGLFFQNQYWMQYKHFLFNDFNVLCSLFLPNIIFIITNTAYIHMKLLMTNLWQDTLIYSVSFLIVCACLSFTVTLWCGSVGKSTSPGSFKWITDIVLAWKTYKAIAKVFSISSLSTERNHIFHWFCAIAPFLHIVLKNILA